MAYLVVMVVDNPPHEVGDVISWRDENMLSESGHYGIGIKTLQDERFKIIHVPDMSPAEANVLCRPQAGLRVELSPGRGENRVRVPANPDAKIRAYKLNINKLKELDRADILRVNKPKEQRFRMKVDNTPEMLDVINLELTKADFDLAKDLKPVIDKRPGAFVREIR